MIGDSVITTLQRLGWPHPAAILIRHSERPHISSAIGTNDVPLTESGIEAATRMGRELGKHYKSIRLFHSPVLRCAQTAVCIQNGASGVPASAKCMGHRNCLGGSYLADAPAALRLADQLRDKFVRKWFDGELDPATVKPLQASLAEHIQYVTTELLDCQTLSLDVHITHDWNVMVLREGIFGVRYDEAGWPDFLDGIVIRRVNDTCQLSFREADVQYPVACR